MLDVQVGQVAKLTNTTIHADTCAVSADVVIKCVGFTINGTIGEILGKETMNAAGMIDRNLFCVAEAILVDVRGYQSPFGSSVLQAALFSSEVVAYLLHDKGAAADLLASEPPQYAISDFTAGQFVDGIEALTKRLPVLRKLLEDQVLNRCADYHERFTPPQFLEENARAWADTCTMLQHHSGNSREMIEYPRCD